MSVHARGLGARYGRGPLVLQDVDLDVAPGETVGVCGPSGSGKSTLARVLSLLHEPSAGSLTVAGTAVTRWGAAAPAALRRRTGMVFQSPRAAVDPRQDLRAVIAEPLLLAPRSERVPDVDARVDELAASVGLASGLLGRRPHQVSDGQLQRACLARAVATGPAVLVCDEMTAMLDASSTARLVHEVTAWQARSGAAVVAVSHDAALLRRWSDRLLVLREGRVVQPDAARARR
ncbi:ABC transporter ATP-binding protein [Aquipuribacter sp. MA13-6]|uniref:ABC transporter ATP-binding protein n=1 Tax=unclassified Aquipuribacter TaxID=2635084 RepID=UPI003EECE9A3